MLLSVIQIVLQQKINCSLQLIIKKTSVCEIDKTFFVSNTLVAMNTFDFDAVVNSVVNVSKFMVSNSSKSLGRCVVIYFFKVNDVLKVLGSNPGSLLGFE